MVSISDDLLGEIDAEAKRRKTSRSGLIQAATRTEIGVIARDRRDLLEELDDLSKAWAGDVGAAELIRADRDRDG